MPSAVPTHMRAHPRLMHVPPCRRWSEVTLQVPSGTDTLDFQTAGLAVTCVLVNGSEVQVAPDRAGGQHPRGPEAPSLDTVSAVAIQSFKDDLAGHVVSVPIPASPEPSAQHARVTVAFRFRLRKDHGTVLYHGNVAVGPAPVRLDVKLLVCPVAGRCVPTYCSNTLASLLSHLLVLPSANLS